MCSCKSNKKAKFPSEIDFKLPESQGNHDNYLLKEINKSKKINQEKIKS